MTNAVGRTALRPSPGETMWTGASTLLIAVRPSGAVPEPWLYVSASRQVCQGGLPAAWLEHRECQYRVVVAEGAQISGNGEDHGHRWLL